MTGPADLRREPSELARALPRELAVEVVGVVRHHGIARLAGERVEHVEAVGREREPVAGAPQGDLTRGVSRQVHDLESCDLVAFGKGAFDLHGLAVPYV